MSFKILNNLTLFKAKKIQLKNRPRGGRCNLFSSIKKYDAPTLPYSSHEDILVFLK